MNIYQLFPRVFGNKNDNTVFDGDKDKNGCGTFADIDDTAIEALKSLGITHIWLTGVLRHASLTAYPELGINATHRQITKGKTEKQPGAAKPGSRCAAGSFAALFLCRTANVLRRCPCAMHAFPKETRDCCIFL